MNSIRFAPPLVISEEDVRKAVRIIGESLDELDKVCNGAAWPRTKLIRQLDKIPGDDEEEHDTVIELED
jgi:ornithine--oxo-acid transaminase